jgi:hypothetical protein
MSPSHMRRPPPWDGEGRSVDRKYQALHPTLCSQDQATFNTSIKAALAPLGLRLAEGRRE